MLEALRSEIAQPETGAVPRRDWWLALGYQRAAGQPAPLAEAEAVATLFREHPKHVYVHDRIAGSQRGLLAASNARTRTENDWARSLVDSYGRPGFLHNTDHYAPDYAGFLQQGVGGVTAAIAARRRELLDTEAPSPGRGHRLHTLEAMATALAGFADLIAGYAAAARERAGAAGTSAAQRRELAAMAASCECIVSLPPETFRDALQLVWLVHTAFLCEGRYAMAFGRMDQYLLPWYEADLRAGRITAEEATDLLAHALLKITEMGREDVCNIAIGGVTRDGADATNALSHCLLDAVARCRVAGPNLSARIAATTPPDFLDACLRLIGSGSGYPALMNDEVNIPALARHGYCLEDCRDYAMVGCIENFLPGLQPPWSDGRFNSPKYLELALNDGICMQTGLRLGPATGTAAVLGDMDALLDAFRRQLEAGAADYMSRFWNENARHDRRRHVQPFLSCFSSDAVRNAASLTDGGSRYPSVHGAGCMGIATVADSLAAIEEVVFRQKAVSLTQLRAALLADFKGYEDLQNRLLAAPKYGNNQEAVDRYAVWYVEVHEEIFRDYRTWDGGAIFTAIASNVQNVDAGRLVAATPDGRHAGTPLSDAASPMHGRDRSGPTAVLLSVAKPDYRLVSCGTVLNQKYDPAIFRDPERRAKLARLIRVYFAHGGQEIQINAVAREVLLDAMAHPERHQDLVTRVSGFSARFVTLTPEVQQDILARTEHG